ncbi:GNAT family N-acetyltransferase [Acetonema longum]|uniref:GNAT family acetyltransferase n=1 Tax=Acetonema longum DSM 6540 TaxID=1009370 RepID=F7NE43_9FIRM|nr:GNAT family N-acetyltransferase [Acetonema longum]EGO65698.1 GNAT family acetyltransferase [Acetonema longum DSM 6540]
MTHCAIQTLTEAHLPAVLDIYNYYIQHTTATFHERPHTMEEMRQLVLFDNPRYQACVFTGPDGLVCGYFILTQYKKREAYDRTAEATVYLKPDHLGKGLGTLALSHLEKLAKERGIAVLMGVICAENQASVNLFAKNGYENCGHLRQVGIKFGRILDIVLYQKILTST